MNDWEIKRFLIVILAIQLAMWGAIGLEITGLQIPLIRQIIGIIYLLFLPGIIILRILKLHQLNNIETLVYAVGLSCATLVFMGLTMNILYPVFGISEPISPTLLVLTISIIVLALCIACYVIDKDFSFPKYIEVKEVLAAPVLFLCLLPFISMFGTYLVNFHHSNILLMFLIGVIALLVILIGFNKFIHANLYPLAVFVIAISILFYRSLISIYISGFDIHAEYYFSNLVLANAIWDPTMPGILNTLLSITMLAPIISLISNVSLTWIFKIFFPFLFSLAILGLYRIFQKQTNDKIAFLSCFVFVSFARIYHDIVLIPRQITAMFFLILLILLIIDKNMIKMKRSFLMIIFAFSIVVSHYGISYIYAFLALLAWLILVLYENFKVEKLINLFYSKFNSYKTNNLNGNYKSLIARDSTITLTFIVLFLLFILLWYIYISGSSVFNFSAQFGDHIISSFSIDFLKPDVIDKVRWLQTKTLLVQLLQSFNIIISYLFQIFILVGFVVVLIKPSEFKFKKEYLAFSMASLVLFIALLPILPISYQLYALGLDIGRISNLLLIFLAPFSIIGGVIVFRRVWRMVRVSWFDISARRWLKVLSVYFGIFLLLEIALYVSGGDIWRISRIPLFGLASFCIIGGIVVIEQISRRVKISWTDINEKKFWLKILSIYLVISFLLATGFFSVVTQEGYTDSVSLGQEQIKKYGSLETKVLFYYSALTFGQDVSSAEWLHMNMNPENKVYSTYNDIRVHALTSYGMIPRENVLALTDTQTTIPKDAYIYLQYLNIVEGIGTEFTQSSLKIFDMSNNSAFIENMNTIYDNGGSEIYR